MKDEIIRLIKQRAIRKEYEAGEIIFSQDDDTNEMYWLESGLSLTYALLADGTERNVLITWSERVFGASTFFEKVPRRTSAMALKKCSVYVIGRELYRECCTQFPDFRAELLKELSVDLGIMFEQLIDSSVLSVNTKVARFICRRISRSQCAVEDGRYVLRYTQDFIAKVLGISRLSVNHALSELVSRGYICTGYSAITVTDTDGIRSYAYPDSSDTLI